MKTIGFIGCGNMGGALAKAASKAKNIRILISSHNPAKAEMLKKDFSCEILSNAEIAGQSDVLFLGVKPNVLPSLLSEIAPFCKKDVVYVSMATAVTMEKIASLVGQDRKIVRIMPNTPVAIGKGVIAYCKNDAMSEEESSFVKDLLSPAGSVYEIAEKLIDAESAVAGCGPAYAYMFAEALADGGVLAGLPREKAIRFAAEMMRGAAEMILMSGKHPGELKDAVCSPGGSTIEGVRSLEEAGFRGAVMDAVSAAYEKTIKMR